METMGGRSLQIWAAESSETCDQLRRHQVEGHRGHRDLTQTAAGVVRGGVRGSQGGMWRQWVSRQGWPSERASWQHTDTEDSPGVPGPSSLLTILEGAVGRGSSSEDSLRGSHVASGEAAVRNRTEPNTGSTLGIWGRAGRGLGSSEPLGQGCHVHSAGEGLPAQGFRLPCPVCRRTGVSPGTLPGLWAPSALLCWQMQKN